MSVEYIGDCRDFYSLDQMSNYARACVNAALEQAEQKCIEISEEAWDDYTRDLSLHTGGISRGADKCAEAVRAMITREQK